MANKVVCVLGAALVALLFVVGGAAPASAELGGPCEARGTIQETGLEIDPSASSGPYNVPLEGTVEWSGQVGDGSPTDPRRTDGAIAVVAPPLIDEIFGGFLEFREWGDDDAESTAESDVDEYELPSVTPRNTEIKVTGFHNDPVGSCDGEVIVIVEGSATDSPLAAASLAATVITGAGVAVAGIRRAGR